MPLIDMYIRIYMTVMNTASAMAAGYLAFQESDPKYAATLLQHAKDLYEFGESCPGDYIKVR